MDTNKNTNQELNQKLSLAQRRALAFIGSKHHDWASFSLATFGDFLPVPRTATYQALAARDLTTIVGGFIVLAPGVSVSGLSLN